MNDMSPSSIWNPRTCRRARIWPFFLCVLGLALCPAFLLYAAENPTPAIRLDQVGYSAGAPKIALVASPAETPAKTFDIRRSSDGEVALHGVFRRPQPIRSQGTLCRQRIFPGCARREPTTLKCPASGRAGPSTLVSTSSSAPISGHARLLRAALRNSCRSGAGVSGILPPGLPPAR